MLPVICQETASKDVYDTVSRARDCQRVPIPMRSTLTDTGMPSQVLPVAARKGM